MKNLLRCVVVAAAVGLPGTGHADTGPMLRLDREGLSHPMEGLTPDELKRFQHGRSLMRQSWVVAPAGDGEVDGLGPLYNRLACISCHAKNGRGGAPAEPQQRMQSMLVRLSVPGKSAQGGPRPHPVYGEQLNEEGVPGVPGEGRARIQWIGSTVRLADGTRVPLRRPRVTFTDLAYGPLGSIRFSLRVSPHIAGLGLLEAIPAAALVDWAHSSKPDGVRGRVNQVWDQQTQTTVVGRFGLKANAPTLRQQIAGAFLGDMGITSDLFPTENCMPTQQACRSAASGGHPELSREGLDDVEFYLAHLQPPMRRDTDAPAVRQGEALFAESGCAVCHRPAMQGGAHPKYPRLSGQTVAAYTDLLLHDMGAELADNRPDFLANGRQWRTPPLWGLGLLAAINEDTGYLHDGRARTPEEAILWHAGEARPARNRYIQLPKPSRQALLAFLQSL